MALLHYMLQEYLLTTSKIGFEGSRAIKEPCLSKCDQWARRNELVHIFQVAYFTSFGGTIQVPSPLGIELSLNFRRSGLGKVANKLG